MPILRITNLVSVDVEVGISLVTLPTVPGPRIGNLAQLAKCHHVSFNLLIVAVSKFSIALKVWR